MLCDLGHETRLQQGEKRNKGREKKREEKQIIFFEVRSSGGVERSSDGKEPKKQIRAPFLIIAFVAHCTRSGEMRGAYRRKYITQYDCYAPRWREDPHPGCGGRCCLSEVKTCVFTASNQFEACPPLAPPPPQAVGAQTVLEVVCDGNRPAITTGCGGMIHAVIDIAKVGSSSRRSSTGFDGIFDIGAYPDGDARGERARRGNSASSSHRGLSGSSSGFELDQGLLLVMVTIGLLLVIAGLCCLDIFLRKYPRSSDFLKCGVGCGSGGGRNGDDGAPEGAAGRHRRTPVSTP